MHSVQRSLRESFGAVHEAGETGCDVFLPLRLIFGKCSAGKQRRVEEICLFHYLRWNRIQVGESCNLWKAGMYDCGENLSVRFVYRPVLQTVSKLFVLSFNLQHFRRTDITLIILKPWFETLSGKQIRLGFFSVYPLLQSKYDILKSVCMYVCMYVFSLCPFIYSFV
jgi:hypothetical protein